MMEMDGPGACPVCGSSGMACRPVYEAGLKIVKEEDLVGGHTLKERTYLDEKGSATTDPEKAQVLLGIEGDLISDEAAKNAGLSGSESDDEDGDDGASYRDLQAKAKALGLPASGSKEDLQERISEAEEAGAGVDRGGG